MWSVFLRSEVQENPEFCCLQRVIFRVQSERALAPALQQEAQSSPNHSFYTGDTQMWEYTHAAQL